MGFFESLWAIEKMKINFFLRYWYVELLIFVILGVIYYKVNKD